MVLTAPMNTSKRPRKGSSGCQDIASDLVGPVHFNILYPIGRRSHQRASRAGSHTARSRKSALSMVRAHESRTSRPIATSG